MVWGWLRRWWRSGGQGSEPPVRHWQVLLYTRQGCSLCHEAWQHLQEQQRQHGFTLQAVDVDTEPSLAAEHGWHVPVVAINGRIRFRGRINPVLWRRLLQNALGERGA
jgi:glutaredoxin